MFLKLLVSTGLAMASSLFQRHMTRSTDQSAFYLASDFINSTEFDKILIPFIINKSHGMRMLVFINN